MKKTRKRQLDDFLRRRTYISRMTKYKETRNRLYKENNLAQHSILTAECYREYLVIMGMNETSTIKYIGLNEKVAKLLLEMENNEAV